LIASLSRNEHDQPEIFEDGRCFLAKIDLNIYHSPAFCVDPNGHAAVLAGNPVFGGAPVKRSTQLAELTRHWRAADWYVLRQAEGTFCAAYYDAAAASLCLMTDKIGCRGLFFWAGDEYVIFASALRILETMRSVPKRVNARAIAEMTAFGFPLGDRTPYKDIIRLQGGELASVTGSQLVRSYYWKWDEVPASGDAESALAQRSYDLFALAVKNRLFEDIGAVSFLSGGLDSRAIVAALRELGCDVWSWTASFPGTLESTLAREFAKAAGTFHTEGDAFVLGGKPVAQLFSELLDSAQWPHFDVNRPRLIWSGDGGSVGVGHVYISRRTADFLKSSLRDQAVGSYLKEVGAYVPAKLLKAPFRDGLASVVRECNKSYRRYVVATR
jgi:hypothetical protein